MITSRINLACGCISLGNMRNCQMSNNIFFKKMFCVSICLLKRKPSVVKVMAFYDIVMELCFVYIEFLHFVSSSILEWQGYFLLPLMVPAAGLLFPCNVSNSFAILNQTISFSPLEPPHFWKIDAADFLGCSEISYLCSGGLVQRPGQTQRMCGCVFWSRGRYKRLIRSVFESLIPKESPDQSAARSSCVFCLMKGKKG